MYRRTLTLKKMYFDEIKSGKKTTEYRRDSPYYEFLHDLKTPFELHFHYYTSRRLKTIAKRARYIKTPKFLETIDTEKCWAIDLEFIEIYSK